MPAIVLLSTPNPAGAGDRDESAWLVDWNGKLLKTLNTHSRNTSGMAYGDGCVWMGAIFQIDIV